MTAESSDGGLDEIVEKLFSRTVTQDTVTRAESEGLDPVLWKKVSELGLAWIGIDDTLGGSGGSLMDLLVVLQAAGRHAVPLPLAETNLASWALTTCGSSVTEGTATLVPGSARDTLVLRDRKLNGTAHGVPWADQANRIVCILADGPGHAAVSVERASLTIRPGVDLAGLPADTVTAEEVEVTPLPWVGPGDAAVLRGGLLRAALMTGTLQAVRDLTVAYTMDRSQFGKPVGANQSVQQHLVTLAQAAATADSAVRQAVLATEGGGEASFAACAAKLVVNRVASVAVRAAHQAHGAIGMTSEYRLQQLTRRLNAWRRQYGTDEELSTRIGIAVAEQGSTLAFINGEGSI
ncbi:MAG: acyl-CoA/acyl-ACP dehydrogenase [Acidobacteriota bacterium]|nr:acyl-CoA/acyl-ACP dehydrogenase [Acidobacteriota bacterium]